MSYYLTTIMCISMIAILDCKALIFRIDENRSGWFYIILSGKGEIEPCNELLYFNEDNVCLVNPQTVNDSTKFILEDEHKEDITANAKFLMRGYNGSGKTYFWFYFPTKEEQNLPDSIWEIKQAEKSFVKTQIHRYNEIESKGYFK